MCEISAKNGKKAGKAAGSDQKAAERGAQGAAAVRRARQVGGGAGPGAGLLCPDGPCLLGAFADALPGGHAGRGRDPSAVHRADDLLQQGAGSAEHGGDLCGGGRAAGGGMTAAGTKRDG